MSSYEELQGIKSIENLGIKNGIIDIGKGVAGIFIKPYQEGKKSVIGRFFQEVGIGLIGVAVSPVITGLRIANNLINGIKNTEFIFFVN